ncbi:hypothetical protein N7532_010025 [Penicillium argentinense]|uniref:Uncharacterized protein n=1 Tax=Penicillium argentinense TaxID=1131581 RepID=A0A9W9EP40_9EURO|nr:uncharacterized protein N7532_010025 [Penicillium argentinense]KAJ5085254.1 hypothetical protein N7532_010025 [Penicillium argentinense]
MFEHMTAAAATGIATTLGTSGIAHVFRAAVGLGGAGFPVTVSSVVGQPAPFSSVGALLPAPALLGASVGGTIIAGLGVASKDVTRVGSRVLSCGGREDGAGESSEGKEAEVHLHFSGSRLLSVTFQPLDGSKGMLTG